MFVYRTLLYQLVDCDNFIPFCSVINALLPSDENKKPKEREGEGKWAMLTGQLP